MKQSSAFLGDKGIEKFHQAEGDEGQMLRRFECIAEDLGFYFISYGEVEELLTPFNYEAVEVCLRQGQHSALSISSFLGSASLLDANG